ncbi:MAG: hypothetical protein HDT27_06325 [Subdoligranulum sp.]|nr:hypothetical protein [Subdoligranulum sp.]
MTEKEIHGALIGKFEREMRAYAGTLLQADRSVLVVNAPEIAAMNTCYGWLVSGECDVLNMAFLLGLEDPLALMKSGVLKEQNAALPDQIDRVLRTLRGRGPAKRSRNPTVFTPLCPVPDYSTL